MLRFIFLCFTISFSFSALAQLSAIDVSKIQTELKFYNQLNVFEDKQGDTPIAELINNNKRYFNKPNTTHSFGYSHSVYWFSNTLINPSKSDINLYLTNIGSVNYLEVFLVQNGQVVLQKKHGSKMKYDELELKHREPLFELRFAPKSRYELYLKYTTDTSFLITPAFYTRPHFNNVREDSAYFFGAYFGILIAIFIYILSSAIISKQLVLMYYSVFLGGTIFINHALNNFSSSVFGLNHTQNFVVAVSILGCTIIIAFFEFCFSLFSFKKYSPKFVTKIRHYFYPFVAFCMAFLLLGDLVIATQLYFFAMSLTIILGLMFLFLILKNKLTYSLLFSLAWISYYMTLIRLNLAWTGMIDYNPDYLIDMYIATMIETIVFSFIVALRYQHVHSVSDSKTELLATAGHDIRQPLQAIMLYKDALSHEVNSEKGHDILASLKQSIASLHQLLNKLLDITNIETGQVKINKSDFQITDVINNLVEVYKPVAIDKGLELKTKITPEIIHTDSVLLATIIRNILANALRYVDDGKILITGRKRQYAYLLQIWDTGEGIDAEKLKRIFDQYFQTDRYKKNEGIGLGLFICQQFAKRLNIKIDVHSKRMKGTVFSLWIYNEPQ